MILITSVRNDDEWPRPPTLHTNTLTVPPQHNGMKGAQTTLNELFSCWYYYLLIHWAFPLLKIRHLLSYLLEQVLCNFTLLLNNHLLLKLLVVTLVYLMRAWISWICITTYQILDFLLGEHNYQGLNLHLCFELLKNMNICLISVLCVHSVLDEGDYWGLGVLKLLAAWLDIGLKIAYDRLIVLG